MSALPVYLKASEVAQMLQLDPKSVYRLADTDSSFPATRIGPRSIRFNRDAILRYLEERTQGARRRRAAAA
jgi:excisionase family DNA binding protein